MDPHAALLAAFNDWIAGDLTEATEHMGAYRGWRFREGFEPEVCGELRWLSGRHCPATTAHSSADFIAAALADQISASVRKIHGFPIKRFSASEIDRVAAAEDQAENEAAFFASREPST